METDADEVLCDYYLSVAMESVRDLIDYSEPEAWETESAARYVPPGSERRANNDALDEYIAGWIRAAQLARRTIGRGRTADYVLVDESVMWRDANGELFLSVNMNSVCVPPVPETPAQAINRLLAEDAELRERLNNALQTWRNVNEWHGVTGPGPG